MKRIIQKSGFDCAICSIAMITGVPYATVKRAAKKRGGYSSQTKKGIKTDRIENITNEIGKKIYSVEAGQYFNIASALKGRKGILMWKSLDITNKIGHAVAWDGFNVVCPSANSVPKESINSYNNYLKRTNREFCRVIGIDTPMYLRVVSLVYCFFPTLVSNIKTEIKDDYKRASNLLRKACVSSSKHISVFIRSMVCCFRLKKSTTRP